MDNAYAREKEGGNLGMEEGENCMFEFVNASVEILVLTWMSGSGCI